MTQPGTSFADPGGGAAAGGALSRDVQVNLNADVSGYSKALDAAQQQTLALTGTVDRLSQTMGNLGKLAATGIRVVNFSQNTGMKVATGDAALLEHQLATLRATSSVTGSSMSEMKKQIDDTFSTFPVARGQVVALYETIANLGVTSPKAVGSMANTFEKLGEATGEDPNALASGNIQLGRQMGNTQPEQIAGYANSLLVVAKSQGVAVSGVTEFASAIAPMARAAGIGEAAVIGISGAFQKAGADGAYAANAFNQIMNDITALSANGSPELAKYASFAGKDTTAFGKESGTDKATQMFSALTKGGPEALSFMNNLGLGARGLKAFQAVGQAGGIAAPIAESQAASGDTKALDAAFKAASVGLSDSLVSARNELTKFGEILGGPLLGFSTKLADAFGFMMSTVNKFTKALGPLPGVISTLVSWLSGPAAFALSHLGVIGTMAAARTMLGPNSMPRVAYRAGTDAGVQMATEIPRLVATGMTKAAATTQAREEALSKSRAGRRVLEGTANWRTSLPLQAGITAGMRPGYAASGGTTGRLGQGLVGASNFVLGTATWLADETTRQRHDAGVIGDDRSGNVPRPPGSTWKEHLVNPSFRQFRQAGYGAIVESAHATGSAFTSVVGGTMRAWPQYEQAKADRGLRLAGNAAAKAVDTTGMNRAQAKTARDDARAAVPGMPVIMQSRIPPEPPPPRPGYTSRGGGTTTMASGLIVPSGGRLPVVGPALVEGATKVGGLAASGIGSAYRGLSTAAGALFSPIGMIASMVGIPLISGLLSSIKKADEKKADQTEALAGGSKYDQRLDRASTNLAKFGSAVDDAADKLSKYANTPLKDLAKWTDADKAAVAGDYKISDPALKTIVDKAKEDAQKRGGDSTAVDEAVKKAIGNYLVGQGIQAGSVPGDTFTTYKRDVGSLLGADQGPNIEAIMAEYAGKNPDMKNPTPDFAGYGALAAVANQGGGNGQLEDFKDIFGRGLTALDSATGKSGVPGKKAEVAGFLQMAGTGVGAVDKGQQDRIAQISQFAEKTFGIKPEDWGAALGGAAESAGAWVSNERPIDPENPSLGTGGTPEFSSGPQAISVLANTLWNTPQGQQKMLGLGFKSPEDMIVAAQNNGELPPPTTSEMNDVLNTKGPLGQWAASPATGGLFQSATTGNQAGNAGVEFAAATEFAGVAAAKAGGNYGDAAAKIRLLSDSIDGGAGATGRLMASAAAWIERLQSWKQQDMSSPQALASVVHDAATAKAETDAAKLPGGPKLSDETVKSDQDKMQAGQDATQAAKQTMIGRIVAMKAYLVSTERAEAANKLQIFNSNRDFALSQQRASDAYQLQKSNAEEDFGIQQGRAAEDANTARLRAQEDYQIQSERSTTAYHLTVSRQTADHIRDLKRQAMAAAQDIYDPFSRTQAKATTDAGTLIYNLAQQNADIEKQMAQIAELKKKGLSQNSIDMLKLTDSSQAQEVDALTMSLTQNPNMTGQINAQTDARLANTTKATQTPDSIAFRQSEEDFKQGMSRQAADFALQMSNAEADYRKGAARMAYDTDKLANRAAADQEKTMARMAAAYKLTVDNAVHDHGVALSDMDAAFKLQQANAAADLATAFTEYSGSFNEIFGQMVDLTGKQMAAHAPAATKLITDWAVQVKNTVEGIFGGGALATPLPSAGEHAGPGTNTAEEKARNDAAVAAQNATAAGGAGLGDGRTSYAFGGISMTRQVAQIGEHGPELHLPLNSRGQDFMAGLIARSLVQGVTTAFSAPANVATSTSNNNTISFDGADIKIVAQDPNDMAKQLAARAKLARLTSPVRH